MPLRRFGFRGCGRGILSLLRIVAGATAIVTSSTSASAYSVLTHQAIIDSVWDDSLKPALRARFPHASEEELRKAHAYLYGGVIIQDMGYYPLGTRFFSDLTHYVRSGDFIKALLEEAKTLEEYAFALGALAHHPADTHGHPDATNRTVALLYPELRARFGDEVAYTEDPIAHIKTEFAFDVLQIARGRYAEDDYHDFIGFEVHKELLERAFFRTYGLELEEVFVGTDLAIGSYRYSVSSLVPEVTEAAWEARKEDIERDNPGIQREKFVYRRLTREEYEKRWGTSYRQREPSRSAKIVAALLKLVPNIGAMGTETFRTPTPEAEKLFLASFDATVKAYRALIARARSGNVELENLNFDIGEPPRLGEYLLADQAYEKWLRELEKLDFCSTSPEIRRNILDYYAGPLVRLRAHKPKDERDSRRSIREAQDDLRELQALGSGGGPEDGNRKCSRDDSPPPQQEG